MDRIDLGTPSVVEVAVPDSPLLTLEALADAATRLPPAAVEQHLATALPRLLPDGRVTPHPASVDEVVRTIATNGSWVMLVSLASLPEYRPLLLALGAPLQLAVRAAGQTPIAYDLIGFVGAPHATVPLHFDRSHHLLVQVRGTKTVGVGWFDDPTVKARQLARGMQSYRLNADREPDRTREFRLAPGQALFLPAFAFHWVEGGDDVSVAATCVLGTDVTQRAAEAVALSAGR